MKRIRAVVLAGLILTWSLSSLGCDSKPTAPKQTQPPKETPQQAPAPPPLPPK